MKKLVVLEPLSVPDDVLEGMFQENSVARSNGPFTTSAPPLTKK